MFAHDFVRNAYLAGTFIALACGVVGWFVVARAQLFAGDALSHVAFVGAIAAAVVGLDERVGLFGLTLAVAGGMAALGRARPGRRRGDRDRVRVDPRDRDPAADAAVDELGRRRRDQRRERAVRLDLLAERRARRGWRRRSRSR